MSKKMEISIDENEIAYLKMNDTEGLNTFSDDFIADVIKAVEDVEKLEPKVLILSGLDEVFSAGADIKNLFTLCDGEVHVKDLMISEKLVEVPFPVIAAMEGHAVGGGLAMATCCDIVIAAKESRYGAVFMSLGFTPGMGMTELLAELMGQFVASEMLYTAKRFKGSQLTSKGTNINYILPKNKVMKKALDIALQISEKNKKSIYLLKNAQAARKKRLLIEARVKEDLMHRLSFGFPETRKTIEEFYAGNN